MPDYTVAPAPRLSQFRAYDCACCGHEEIRHPVFLRGTGGAVAPYGSGCAAVLLYGRKDKATTARAVRAQQAADAEARNWAAEADRVHKHFAAHGALSPAAADMEYARRNNTFVAPEVTYTNGQRWFGWCRQACPAFAERLAELGWDANPVTV